MKIEDYQRSIQTLADLFDGLECLVTHKTHQLIINGFLQIKKIGRRNPCSQVGSVQRRSIPSVSQKNHSARKSSFSGNADRSLDKQSHTSFDIIKGAQIFNQSRRKAGNSQKLYTQVQQPQRGYSSNGREQPTGFTSPSQQRGDYSLNLRKNPEIVPKLVGLASNDELSSIERTARTIQSREQQRKTEFRNYNEGIIEVDDEDDEFEDVVLSRLDMIEQKVSQMLKEKRQQKIQNASHRGPLTPNYYVPRQRLQNVGSGPNIIYSNNLQVNRNNDFYKYQEPRYNTSSVQIPSPRAYTFRNSRNTSHNPSAKKVVNPNVIPYVTERVPLPSRFSEQFHNRMNDMGLYADLQNPQSHGIALRQADTFEIYENQPYVTENPIQKNKKLGHYREYTATLYDGKTVHRPQGSSYNRSQKSFENIIDYSKLKQQRTIDGQNVFKYIPLSKLTSQSRENLPQKTERNITRRQQIVENGQRGNQVVFLQHSRHESNRSQNNDNSYSQRRGQVKDDSYKSKKDNGIRGKQYEGYGVKAYTEQGDFIPNGDDFSVSSDGGIYSQIRQLREMTKQYGAGRERKQNILGQNQQRQIVVSRNAEDYRQHQKTQRVKYVPSKTYSQRQGDITDEEVVIESGYPQERVVRVIKEVPHYSQEIRVLPSQSRAQQEYVEYTATEEPVGYRFNQVSSGYNNQPVYVLRQPNQVYEQIQENQFPYRPSKRSQFRTIVVRDDANSESPRKLSNGSIASFKSIPYGRDGKKKPSLHENLMKDRSEYVIERQGNYDYSHHIGRNEY